MVRAFDHTARYKREYCSHLDNIVYLDPKELLQLTGLQPTTPTVESNDPRPAAIQEYDQRIGEQMQRHILGEESEPDMVDDN